MSRSFEMEVFQWGKSDGAKCAACGEYTEQTVQFGCVGDRYPCDEAKDVCNKTECVDWLMQRCLDETQERWHNRKQIIQEEKWNSRDGK